MVAVTVDDDFARFGGKSYAINKINSVEVRKRHPYGRAGAVIAGLGAVLSLAAILNDTPSTSAPFIIIAITLAGVSWWQWRRSNTVEFVLYLMTSSSETQAFVSRDRTLVLDLRNQIENAMLTHSKGALR